MPVVVVATMKAKPESVDAVREAGKKAIEAVKTHSRAPAVASFFGTVGELLDGAPDVKVLQTVVAGDPAKAQLRP